MKAAFKTLLGLALVLCAGVVALAADKKEDKGKVVTLKGELTCAKCGLKMAGITKCTNAIKVKEGGKEVVYLLDDKMLAGTGKEKYHGQICTSSKPGSVTGVVSTKGSQKLIKPAANGVKYDE